MGSPLAGRERVSGLTPFRPVAPMRRGTSPLHTPPPRRRQPGTRTGRRPIRTGWTVPRHGQRRSRISAPTSWNGTSDKRPWPYARRRAPRTPRRNRRNDTRRLACLRPCSAGAPCLPDPVPTVGPVPQYSGRSRSRQRGSGPGLSHGRSFSRLFFSIRLAQAAGSGNVRDEMTYPRRPRRKCRRWFAGAGASG